jgi:hypothetical protein
VKNDLRLLRACCLSGFVGSAMYLAGDMLFYGAFRSGSDFHPYQLMAGHSATRLIAGGLLGPIASLFSAFGMLLFYLTLKPGSRRLACTASALLAAMILFGGSYHALYTVLGFASQASNGGLPILQEVTSLRNAIGWPLYICGIAGSLITYWLTLARETLFPRWLLLLLPTTLSLASTAFPKVFHSIPAPLGGIILGGWINGTFVVFFAACVLVFWGGFRQRRDGYPSSASRVTLLSEDINEKN